MFYCERLEEYFRIPVQWKSRGEGVLMTLQSRSSYIRLLTLSGCISQSDYCKSPSVAWISAAPVSRIPGTDSNIWRIPRCIGRRCSRWHQEGIPVPHTCTRTCSHLDKCKQADIKLLSPTLHMSLATSFGRQFPISLIRISSWRARKSTRGIKKAKKNPLPRHTHSCILNRQKEHEQWGGSLDFRAKIRRLPYTIAKVAQSLYPQILILLPHSVHLSEVIHHDRAFESFLFERHPHVLDC